MLTLCIPRLATWQRWFTVFFCFFFNEKENSQEAIDVFISHIAQVGFFFCFFQIFLGIFVMRSKKQENQYKSFFQKHNQDVIDEKGRVVFLVFFRFFCFFSFMISKNQENQYRT